MTGPSEQQVEAVVSAKLREMAKSWSCTMTSLADGDAVADYLVECVGPELSEALTALFAATPVQEPEGEPVAWQTRGMNANDTWAKWCEVSEGYARALLNDGRVRRGRRQVRPLYARPASSATDGEPVAWLYEWAPQTREKWTWEVSTDNPIYRVARRYRNIQPLYTRATSAVPSDPAAWHLYSPEDAFDDELHWPDDRLTEIDIEDGWTETPLYAVPPDTAAIIADLTQRLESEAAAAEGCRQSWAKCQQMRVDENVAADTAAERLQCLLRMRDRQAEQSKDHWMRAAKKALAGDLRELSNRVALYEAPPVEVVHSEESRDG